MEGMPRVTTGGMVSAVEMQGRCKGDDHLPLMVIIQESLVEEWRDVKRQGGIA